MKRTVERSGRRFLDRVFSKAEQAYCDRKRNKYEHYAARFAAKEAFLKARKDAKGRFSFCQIEVVRDAKGAPSLRIGEAVRRRLGIAPAARFELTISHERDFAVAVVAFIP